MKCPKCGFYDSKVIDSRPTDEGSIRRRRECLSCQYRFTTYEVCETTPIMVIKKDGSRQVFDKNKIINGIIKACEKRPVSLKQIEDIANEVELAINNTMKREIPSRDIGEMIMDRLRYADGVAYVRFASVYREFKDIDTFIKELEQMITEKKK